MNHSQHGMNTNMAIVNIIKQTMFIQADSVADVATLMRRIGTLAVDDKDPKRVRCRTSIQNLQRIKQTIKGVKLSNDAPTRFAIQNLKVLHEDRQDSNREIKSILGARIPTVPYRFKLEPYAHQIFGFNVMHAGKNVAIFGDCGIGKTAIAAWFVESLRKLKQINARDNVLVVCPINIIRQAWLKDVEKFTDLKAVSLYEPSNYKRKEKIANRLKTKADIYIASFSQLRLITKELRAKKFKVIIVDESSKIKNPRSQVFRSLLQVAWKAEWKFIMSGTPSPNGPIDLWSQFFFLDGGLTLEPALVDFRYIHYYSFSMGRATIWRPKDNAPHMVGKLISPRSIKIKASECLDLPEHTRIIRDVFMSQQAQDIYDQMSQDLFVELEDGDMATARIALSKIMKLREITGGFIISDNGDEVEIKPNAKLNALDELLNEIMQSGDHKALIWIQYKWEARRLAKMLQKKYGARILNSQVSAAKKDSRIDRFREDPERRILICHPQSVAHGLTLNEAQYSVYYSLSHNFEEYYQSSRRNYRAGQTKPVFEYHLIASDTVDQSIFTCLQAKQNVQEAIVEKSLSLKALLGIR